jgi:hypothetical protein
LSAWFVAPATTKVRFYMTCDDNCSFDIASVPDTKIDTTVADYKPLITSTGVKGYRQYFDTVTPAAPAPAAPSQNVAGYLTSQLDKDILTVTNEIRMNPSSFVPKLEAMLPKFDTTDPLLYITGTGTNLMTNEGAVAVQEAIDYLNAITTPISEAMQWDQYAEFECKDLVAAQSLTTETGHNSPDGTTMTQRFAKYGQFVGTIGENLAYGKSVAEDIVLQLFVDDGVASRGHRDNIMKPEFKFLGSSSGGHGTYGSMTCIGYAAGFTSNGQYPLISETDPNTAPAATQELGSVTEWVNVEAGKHYHVQGYHYEAHGGDHYTVSVEIEANTQSHHHTMKEVQDLKVDTDVVLEKTLVTVTNPDDMLYILAFQNPVTLASWATEKIPASCDAGTFRNKVKDFYWNTYKSDITVTKTMQDVNGAETTVAADSVKNIYEITLLKMIPDVSTSQIQAVKVDTTASLAVTLPIDHQKSGTPITGKYQIQCVNQAGELSKTREIGISATDNNIQWTIMQDCHQIYDTLEVISLPQYAYKENGIGFRIRFTGLGYDPGEYSIVSGNVTALEGVNLQHKQETVVPFGGNIFYEPIPFEMLKTFETKPQLIVNVGENGEFPAVCHNMTCDFSYIAPVGEITDFTWTAGTKELQLVGTGFPAEADITSIEFAQSTCTISAASATSITCTLDHQETCGVW